MKNYIYYNMNDSKKEPLGKIQAESLNEAIECSINLLLFIL